MICIGILVICVTINLSMQENVDLGHIKTRSKRDLIEDINKQKSDDDLWQLLIGGTSSPENSENYNFDDSSTASNNKELFESTTDKIFNEAGPLPATSSSKPEVETSRPGNAVGFGFYKTTTDYVPTLGDISTWANEENINTKVTTSLGSTIAISTTPSSPLESNVTSTLPYDPSVLKGNAKIPTVVSPIETEFSTHSPKMNNSKDNTFIKERLFFIKDNKTKDNSPVGFSSKFNMHCGSVPQSIATIINAPKFVFVEGQCFPICYTFSVSNIPAFHPFCVIPSQNNKVLDFLPIDLGLANSTAAKVSQPLDPKKLFLIDKKKITFGTSDLNVEGQIEPPGSMGFQTDLNYKKSENQLILRVKSVKNGCVNGNGNSCLIERASTLPLEGRQNLKDLFQVRSTTLSKNSHHIQLSVPSNTNLYAKKLFPNDNIRQPYIQHIYKKNVLLRTKRSSLFQELNSIEEGVSLALVFDTSGSMSPELHLVKQSALRVAKEMLNNSNFAINDFVFVPFQDEDESQQPTQTKNVYDLYDAINNIEIRGGQDCPEKSLEGILKAIQLARPYSFIYVFTDAYAKDYHLVNEIITLCQRKHPQIYFLLTGYCTDTIYPAEQINAYKRIALVSSGLVIDLEYKTDIGKIMRYIPSNSKRGKVLLNSIHSGSGITKPRAFRLDIDTAIKEMTISSTGSNMDLTVINPDGAEPEPAKMHNVLLLDNIKVLCVQEPEPGPWTINITKADSGYSVMTTGISTSSFNYGFSVIPTFEMKETSKRPCKGVQNNILIQISPPKSIRYISKAILMNLDGVPLGEFEIKAIDDNKGLFIGGPFMPPDELFKIEVHGMTYDEFPLKRVTTTAISAQLPSKPFINFQRELIAIAGNPLNITCSIDSLVPVTVKLHRIPTNASISRTFPQTTEVNLHITKVKYIHEGEYICWAQNIAGTSSEKLFLKVYDHPVIRFMPKKVDVLKNGTGYITCNATGTPQPEFYWKFNGTLISHQADNKSYSLLKIHNASHTDSGTYTCIAVNLLGTSSSKTELTVLEPPAIFLWKSQYDVNVEEMAFLECKANGSPKPSIIWYHNNEVFTKGHIDAEGTLSFKVKKTHAGEFICLASNNAGSDSRSLTIFISEPPWFHQDLPRTVDAVIGKNISLVCISFGNPKPTVRWDLTRLSSNSKKIVVIPETGSLNIFNITENEEGAYKCVADNSAGQRIYRVNVTVLVPPKATIIANNLQNGAINENNVLSIKCEVEGKPRPKIYWSKNNISLPYNFSNKLTLKTTEADNGSVIKCTAKNILGTSHSTLDIIVRSSPKIENAKNEKIFWLENTDLVLVCKTRGFPKPKIIWLKDGILIENNIIDKEKNSEVILRNVTSESSGNYSCVAANFLGTAEKFFYVTVQSIPQIAIDTKSNFRVQEGEDVFLSCAATGTPPPQTKWKKESNLLFHNITAGIYMIGNDLFLLNVTRESSGNYICTATNNQGSASMRYTVNVTVPESVTKETELFEVLDGETANLYCPKESRGEMVWLKGGVEVRKSKARSDVVQQEIKDNGARLNFDEVNTSSTGNYSCIIITPEGNITQNFYLSVLIHPFFKNEHYETHYQLTEGSSLAMNCSMGGNPSPTINWRVTNSKYNFIPVTNLSVPKSEIKNNTLLINQTNIDHTGNYMCIGRNKVGQISREFKIAIYGPPRVKRNELEHIRVVLNSPVKLNCDMKGFPEPTYYWTFSPDSRLMNASNQLEYKSNIFFVEEAKPVNTGTYSCTGTNILGRATKDYILKIISLPIIKKLTPSYHLFEESKNALIGCSMSSGNATIVRWKKNGHFIYESDNIQFFKRDNDYFLKILNLTKENEGIYTCLAKNLAGQTEESFNVKVNN